MKGPNGWLNLAGLHWLQAGATSMGSAPDNNIKLAEEQAPPKLGVFLLEGEEVTFQAEPGVEVFSDGVPVTQLRMNHDQAGEPSRLTHGTLGWHLIRRMERLGVRLRDYEHPAVSAFAGLEFYPVDTDWRVEARFNAYEEPRRPMLTTVVEELGWNPTAPGTLEFELDGDALSLEAYDSGDSFFLIFADLTTGETTYPSGRYLYADKPGPDGIHDSGLQQGAQPTLRLHQLRHLSAAGPAKSHDGGHRSRREVFQGSLSKRHARRVGHTPGAGLLSL